MSAAVANSPEMPGQGRGRLDSLPTRARITGEEAAARSRIIRRLRIALPAVAIALIAALILNTRTNTPDPAFLEEFKDLSATTEELRMTAPRFTGVDDRGRPFEITAASAKQRPGPNNLVELVNPRAVQGGENEETIVIAEKGLFQSNESILELEDGVMLEHDIGADTYVLRAPKATVSIKDEVVVSDAGVAGQGPDGAALKAERMTAYRAEGRVVFEGNVSMRIYPKSAQERRRAADEEAASPDNLRTGEL